MSTLDEQLALLSNTHRRHLLAALRRENQQDDSTNWTDTSTAADETQAIAMRHIHLPKLEDYGYIHWQREARRVTKGERFDEIEPLLMAVSESQEIPPMDESFD